VRRVDLDAPPRRPRSHARGGDVKRRRRPRAAADVGPLDAIGAAGLEPDRVLCCPRKGGLAADRLGLLPERHGGCRLAASTARRAGQAGVDLAELALDFPGQLHRILELASSGGLEVHLRTAELEPLVSRAGRPSNRIAAAVLAAAVIEALLELSATRKRTQRRGRRRLWTALPSLAAFAGDPVRRRR
jgi:hypothetical protein